MDYLNGVIEHDSRLLASSRPSPEAAAKAATAGTKGKRLQGKGPKGLAAPKGLGSSTSSGTSGGTGGGTQAAAAVVPSLAAVRAAFASDQMQIAQAGATRQLCQGMMHMCVALSAAGVMAQPPLPFNGQRERFEQRFGSLHILTRPEPLGYEQYAASVDMKGASPSAVLGAASASLAKVRRSCGSAARGACNRARRVRGASSQLA
jgi:hypothetical protein